MSNFPCIHRCFTTGTDFGYWIFIIANEKFTDVLVRTLIKSHVPEPQVRKSDGRLKKYRATASPILRWLRWHSKSFLFNALWRHTLQWRHICFKAYMCLGETCVFIGVKFWKVFQSNISTCKTFWTSLISPYSQKQW